MVDVKPLSGITVLDLSRVLAGPFATMILGDLGADIIKVEPPSGDDTRHWTPIVDGESVYYMSANRNKRSIVINLKDNRGRDILYKLVEKADVFIENFRSDVPVKLGVDYDTIKSIKPDIIYCSIHGFDPDSPYGGLRAADLTIQAMSGLMDSTGIGDEPVRVSFALFDIYAGMVAAISILAGLVRRMETGEGMKIDVNLYDTSIFSMSYIPMIYLMTGYIPRKMGSAHPSIVPYQAFRCRDGRYVAVGIFNDRMWINLCRALGLDDLVDDDRFKTNPDRVRNRDILIPILESRFKEYDRDYWVELLNKYGINVGPVYRLDEVFRDRYVVESGIVDYINHPRLGRIPQLVFPAKLEGNRLRPSRHPPMMGEDTVDILRELGYREEDINRLIEDGVVSTPGK